MYLIHSGELVLAVRRLSFCQQGSKAREEVAIRQGELTVRNDILGQVKVMHIAQQEAQGQPDLAIHIRHLQQQSSFVLISNFEISMFLTKPILAEQRV